MEIPTDYLMECLEQINTLNVDESLIRFGGMVSLQDGVLGAAPLSPQRISERVNTIMCAVLPKLRPEIKEGGALARFLQPSDVDYMGGAVLGVADKISTAVNSLGLSQAVCVVTVGYLSVMIVKFGYKALCMKVQNCSDLKKDFPADAAPQA